PESFLHPSAQAEFGRVLQALAQEFGVQVIVTTHSPYMLCLDNANSNILLKRRIHYNNPMETQRVDNQEQRWMEPFAQALGLRSDEFSAWRNILHGNTETVLLVEGDTDKEYLEMLRDQKHGSGQLKFAGEIVPYEGTGSLQNTVLLRFIKNRFKKVVVTYDL